METTDYIWLNGEFKPWAEAKIHVLTHSLHYGGGAFEGIRVYKTTEGTAIFRIEDHVDRLLYSVNALGMKFPYTRAEIIDAIISVVSKNKLEQGYIRPIAFYGYGKMGVSIKGAPIEFAIACWPWGAYLPQGGVDVKISRYMRIHPDTTVINAKLTGHYLNGILASIEIQGTHYDEVLLLDDKKFIAEGAGENFFIVKNETLYTPKLGSILAGITRQTVIMLAEKFGIPLIEANLTSNDVFNADEAFFTGTAAEITQIRSVDDNKIGNGSMGPITTKIQNAYSDIVYGRNAEFRKYLTYVSF